MGKLRVLELYCGIGGAHFALQESGVEYEVVAAVDVNDHTNAIYRHNFPTTRVMQKSIESISLNILEKLNVDMIHMSPPCQPFTRVGKQQDNEDRRTDSFFSVVDNIANLKKKPEYITVENVKGFEVSKTRDYLLAMLNQSGYTYKEWLLNPIQFGVPNSRLRYYLTAKLTGEFHFETQQEINTELPECSLKYLTKRVIRKKRNQHFLTETKMRSVDMIEYANVTTSATTDNEDKIPSTSADIAIEALCIDENVASPDIRHIDSDISEGEEDEGEGYFVSIKSRTPYSELYKLAPSGLNLPKKNSEKTTQSIFTMCSNQKYRHTCGTLMKYIDIANDSEHFLKYSVPDSEFKHLWTMDLVTNDVSHSCCFTKRYGHHVDGAGSILQVNVHSTADLTSFRSCDLKNNIEYKEVCKSLKLRRFSPTEISNLMCFPDTFSFPDNFTTIQCYRALGNSLNVHVLSVLIKVMVNY